MARLGRSTVVFVHPMNASSVATAVAWEPQAIARVRRVGQKLSLLRFLTPSGTVTNSLPGVCVHLQG